MAIKWKDVTQDPTYIALAEEEKGKVRSRYLNNVVKNDAGFIGLNKKDQQKVTNEFLGLNFDTTDRPFTREFLGLRRAEEEAAIDPRNIESPLRAPIAKILGGSVRSIEAEAQQTKQVPKLKIARRVAGEIASDVFPLTPNELMLDISVLMGAPALLSKSGSFVAKHFPGLHKTLTKSRSLFKTGSPAKEPLPPQPENVVLEPNLRPPEGVPVRPPVTPEQTNTIIQARKTADKEIFGQQLNKFNVSDDAQGIFQETSNVFKGRIDKARRGKIDQKGTEEMARNLGMRPEDLVKRRKGKSFNAEELEAAKGLTAKSLDDVDAARQAYIQTQSPENLIKLNATISRHAALQESFMGARAEAGRAMQILRKSTDPADVAQQNFDDLLKAFGGREMSEEMARRLAMIDPTDIASMNKFIREVVKAKTKDQVYEIWINGLLSSPVTQMRNVLGNSLFISSKVPEKAFKALVDSAISPFFSGARTQFAGEAKRELFALGRGLSEGTRRALHAFKTGLPQGRTKLELSRIPSVPGKIGEAVRFPSRLLIAGDEFAKGIVNRMETAAQVFRKAKLEGKKGADFIKRMAELEANPTEDIVKNVRAEELLRTFQNRGPVIKKLGALRDIGPMKFVVPFLQTPANIAFRGIERSPLGFFKGLSSIVQKKGQKQITEDIGNAVMGSSIAGTIAYQTLQGKITGSPPRDPVERDKFFRSGKLPYSLKIGDTWYSYSAFEPWALTVGATADSVLKAIESDSDPDANVVAAITSAIPRFMVSQTFMSGIRDAMDAVSDGERYGNKYINRLAGSAVPFSSFNRWIAQNIDPIIRRPGDVIESMKVGLPGLSKQVPPLITSTGEPATRPSFEDGFLQGALKNIAIPSRKEHVSPLDIEDEFLERRTTFPSKNLGGIKLNNKEFSRLKASSGKNVTNARKQLQASPGWKTASPEGRNQLLDALVRAARKQARQEIYPQVLKRIQGNEEQRRELIEYGRTVLGFREQDE